MNTRMVILYIDPGTGSMLLTIVIGLVATLLYGCKGLWIKLKYRLSGGKGGAKTAEKIPFVIYTDSKRYWNVFKPICDEFERRKVKLTYLTQSEDDPAFNEKYEYVTREFIGEGSKGFARLNILRAGTVLSTTPSLDVYQWKRSKNVDRYVHIFHDASEGTGYEMFGLDYYDAVLLTAKMQEPLIRELEEKRKIPAKDLQVVGSTYLDELLFKYQENLKSEKTTETSSDEKEDGKKTVLVAPSWGSCCILNRFGEKFLEALKKTGYHIIVRPHPQMKTADPELLKSLMEKFPEGEDFNWNFDNNNYEVLKKSDIMITDFSGVMTDFTAIFDRPLIYADTSFDKSPYDAAWIDGPVWRIAVLDTIGKKLEESDFPRMKEVIDEVLSDDKYAEGRKQYKETIWNCRGEAAKNAVDYLMQFVEKEEAKEQEKADSKAELQKA